MAGRRLAVDVGRTAGNHEPSARRHIGHGRVASLLRSLGRDAHELRARLRRDWPDAADEHLPGGLTAGTLFGTLQCQIRDNENPRLSQPGPLTVTQDDTSIQVHACHGPARQAEVIREAVLRLLQSDPTLEPRDILIMCPDLDVMAPLLSAAFSTPSHSLRLRIADRTPEQANDVLNSLAALLELSTGRVELSTLLDFAGRPRCAGSSVSTTTASSALRTSPHWQASDGAWTTTPVTGSACGCGPAPGPGAWTGCCSARPCPRMAWPCSTGAARRRREQRRRRPGGSVRRVGDPPTATARRDVPTPPGGRMGQHPGGALTDLMEVGGPDAWQLPNAAGAVAALADNAVGYAASVSLSLADIRWLLAEALG